MSGRSDGRGRLRVYLGAAPGVGKTFAMLDEGRRRQARGTDVVVGLVETHGRARTAEQLDGLEVVPRRVVLYRGTEQGELDVDAVLARAPQVCLVDELAHTNAAADALLPDAEKPAHQKRWQDVEQLLAAGIDVVTTLNVQHLESLNDVTEAITGVRQRETVPDAFVRSADAIELVDMSPQSLRRRMAHGNIYAADKVDAALGRFFREGNLAALRELALLWLADRVDETLAQYRDQHRIDSTWATRERIVVAVTGGPESEALLRRAARIASRTGGGEWLALFVGRGDGLRQSAWADLGPARLEQLGRTVGELGGTFHSVVGDDAARAILDFARGHNATQVLLGASRRGRWSTLLRPGIGERVIASSGDIDVHIVTHDEARRASARFRESSAVGRARLAWGFAVAVLGPVLLTGLLLATPDLHGLPAESMLFMAVVVATALVGGLRPAVVAALVSGGALNYFFSPPLRTLQIASVDNVVAVGLFVVVGLAVATVVDRAARLATLARRARAESGALAALSHQLLQAGDDPTRLLTSAVDLFGLTRARIVADDGTVVFADDVSGAEESGESGESGESTSVPLGGGAELRLCGPPLRADDQPLVTAVAAQASVLLDRRSAARADAERRVLAEADRTRTALLAAVSHDLRSPLAAVKVAVGVLRDQALPLTDADRAELLESVDESTDRLDALVENLLDMSRLTTGAVTPHRDRLEVVDLVDRALTASDPGAVVDVRLPDDLPPVVADAGLVERVLANVVENALRHAGDVVTSGKGPVVRIDAAPTDGGVVVRVVDSGPGVPPGRMDALFQPFQRLGDAPRGNGVGLGLAVARGLAEAMGGTLTADDTPGGGLTLLLELPSGGAREEDA